MNVHHNEPENSFDDPEEFCQYHIWLLYGQKCKKIQTNTTQVMTEQLDVV